MVLYHKDLIRYVIPRSTSYINELVSGGTFCPVIDIEISPVTAFCGKSMLTFPSSLIAVPPYWEIILSGVLNIEVGSILF